LGTGWTGNRWEDVLEEKHTRHTVPNTDGATGIVMGMQYKSDNFFVPTKKNIREVRLLLTKGVNLTNGIFKPLVEHKTFKVEPETNTFFVPDSLLFSKKGQEWQLEIPRGDPPWRYEYLIEWQDPDIAFDSTIVRGKQLFQPPVLGSFASSPDPGTSGFGFQQMNLLQEVVVGRKQRPLKRTLRKTDCELYEERLYEMQYKTSGGDRKSWMFVKDHTHSWGWYPYGGAKVIMYLGCGRYRDIGYIRNITIPADFPLPDYGAAPSSVEDTRSTVYWNPNIVTDADGTATFSFYTSDTGGEYSISAQGIDIHSLTPVSGQGHFNVSVQ